MKSGTALWHGRCKYIKSLESSCKSHVFGKHPPAFFGQTQSYLRSCCVVNWFDLSNRKANAKNMGHTWVNTQNCSSVCSSARKTFQARLAPVGHGSKGFFDFCKFSGNVYHFYLSNNIEKTRIAQDINWVRHKFPWQIVLILFQHEATIQWNQQSYYRLMGLIWTGRKSSTCLSSKSETLYKPAVQLAATLSSEHIFIRTVSSSGSVNEGQLQIL